MEYVPGVNTSSTILSAATRTVLQSQVRTARVKHQDVRLWCYLKWQPMQQLVSQQAQQPVE